MEYLRIDEDGAFSQVQGDPEQDEELLKEVEGDLTKVFRYRGNRFEYLIVEDNGDENEPDLDCTWEAA